MFARNPLVIAAFLLIANGCAYSSAMGRGARSEGSGDWVAALAAYDEAVAKKPDEQEAVEARARAKDALVEQALREAGDALSIGDFEIVMEKLSVASGYDSDRPEVYELTGKAEAEMAARYDRHFEAESWDEAYDMAVRTRKLFPESGFLDNAFSELRKHYTESATASLKKKAYPEALETLRTIVKFEPDRQGDIVAQEQEILAAWGKQLAGKGSTAARSRQYGAAAAWFARAYEVAGTPEYLTESREIAGRLEPEGLLTVSLSVSGDRKRIDHIEERILAGLVLISDTEVVGSRGMLDARVAVGTSKCTETDAVTPTEKDFISGKVEEPNPEWHQLTDDLAAQRELEATAANKASAVQPDLAAAQEALQAIDSQLVVAQGELATATASVQDAQTQLDTNKTRRDGLQEDLAGYEAAGSAGLADQVRTQLGELGGILSEWSGQVIERGEAVSAAQRTVKVLEAERGPASQAEKRLKTGYDAILADQTEAANNVLSLSTKLGSTSETVWKDVHELLKYDVHDWTRTCVAPVKVNLRPSWEAGVPITETYSPSHLTEDRAQPGHEKAAVKEDLKEYPIADEALIAKGDEATLKEIWAWLDKVADDHFKVRKTEATMALVENPVGGTTELVRLYVGAKGRLDENTLKTFQAHLKSHYGLEKMELLAPPSGS